MKKIAIAALLIPCSLWNIVAAEDRPSLRMDNAFFAFDNGVGRGRLTPRGRHVATGGLTCQPRNSRRGPAACRTGAGPMGRRRATGRRPR